MKPVLMLCLALILATSVFIDTNAQQQGDQRTGKQKVPVVAKDDVLSLNAALVTVPVRVTGLKGSDIEGLDRDHFQLYEDRVLQSIAFFSADDQPITAGLVIDKSQSMKDGNKQQHVQEAVASILSAMHPQNELFYLAFDHEANIMEDFTTDRQAIMSALQSTKAEGGTSLYDAVIEGLQHLKGGRYTRQALVVVSDGLDQHSRHTLADVLKILEESVAQVYFIGFYSEADKTAFAHSGPLITLADGRRVDNPRYALERLASESGTEVFFPESAMELQRVASIIAHDLRRQYLLAYYPPNPEDREKYRPIIVKVRAPQFGKVSVRARRGYRIGEPQASIEAETKENNGKTRLPDLGSFYKIVPAEATTEPAKAADPAAGPPAGNAMSSYKDDFSDPASGWPNTPTSFYRHGAYHLTEKGTVLVHGPSFVNFRAQVTVQLYDGPSSEYILGMGRFHSPGLGLVFRLNEDGYYAFYVGVPPGGSKRGHYKLIKRLNGRDIELIRWSPDELIGAKTRLGVSCNGDVIELFIQGRLVRRVVDSSLHNGFVGFTLTDKADAAFDDLEVISEQ